MASEAVQTAGKNLSEEKFSIANFRSSSFIFNFASDRIGLRSSGERYGLCMVIFIPIVAFAIVTCLENRFFYRSVTEPLNKICSDIHPYFTNKFEEYRDVLGMSFLGDTSVWPYIFLVPLCLLLTKYAIKCSFELLEQVSKQVSNEWRKDNTELGYNTTVNKTKMIFGLEYGWEIKGYKFFPLQWVPIALAIFLWMGNTINCAFHDNIKIVEYPYKSDKVIILPEPENERMPLREKTEHPKIVSLTQEIYLPKWDCDPENAPLSCWTARIWALFYYGFIPFLLSHIITIIWGVTTFLMGARRWNNSKEPDKCKSALDLQLFSEDGFGGLGDISKTGESYFFVFTSFILLVTTSLFKEGTPPSWYNYLFIVLLIPFAIAAFLIPAFAIRQSIIGAKRPHLFVVNKKINVIYSAFREGIHERSSLEMIKLHYQLLSLKNFYEQIKSLPEWPFTTSTFFRIGFSAGLPFLVAKIEALIKSI